MHTLIIVESPNKARKFQEYLGKDYTVIASVGHVRDLAIKGMGIDFTRNFKPHYVMNPDKHQVVSQIIQAAETADQIFLASDPDREGTAIAWHVAQLLNGYRKPMKRITFNEITKKAILKAIDNAHEIDMQVVSAQETRRLLDQIGRAHV